MLMDVTSLLNLPELSVSRIAWGVGLGVGMLIGSVVVGTIFVISLPPTYFTRPRSARGNRHSLLHWAWVIVKNVLGVVLIVMGVAMLVLPGQGVLTILIGLMMLSIPGKRKLVASLIRRTAILPSLNRLRARFGKEPLLLSGT